MKGCAIGGIAGISSITIIIIYTSYFRGEADFAQPEAPNPW